MILREVAPDSRLAAEACLWFIAGQAALGYFMAGVVKLKTASWRDGSALAVILRHGIFGHEGIATFLDEHPAVCRLATWGVLFMEITFPLGICAGEQAGAAYVLAALSMHLSIGYFMGLHRFVSAWAATFPALLYLSNYSISPF